MSNQCLKAKIWFNFGSIHFNPFQDDAENLEWDQDESVEPHIVVNPLDTELEDQATRSVRRRTDRADEEIEMSEMAG